MKNRHTPPAQVRRNRLARWSVAAIFASLLAASAHATDLYWDADGNTTAATGGTGSWTTSTSSMLWRNGSSTGALQAWVNGNNAIFGGTAGTVTNASAISATGVTVNTTAYTLTGSSSSNTLTLTAATGAPTFSVAASDYATAGTFVSNANGTAYLAGTNGLTVSGGGELILAAGLQNSLSGGISVTGTSSASTILTVGDRNQGTSSNVNLTGGGAGAAGFFGGNNLSLDYGTLRIAASSSGNSALSGLGNITISDTGTFNIYRTGSSSSMSPNLTTNSTANVTMNAGSTLAVTTGGNTTGSPTVSFGALTANGAFTIQGQAGTVNAEARFTAVNDNGYTMTLLGGGTSTTVGVDPIDKLQTSGGALTGTSLTGNLVLGNAAGTQGAFYRVSSSYNLALTTGNVTVNPYSQLYLGTTGTYGTAGTTPSLLTLNGIGNQNAAQTSGNSGALRVDATGVVWQGAVAFGSASILSVTTGNDGTFTGNVADNGYQLQKQGSGNFTLSGTGNVMTGSTLIGNGALIVSSGSSMGTGDLTLYQTSTNNTALTLNNATQSVGNLSSNFTATTGTQTQVITLNGTALTVNQSVAGTYGSGAVSTLTSTITGTGSLIKAGSATLTLSGSNNYTGSTSVNAGTLLASGTSGTGALNSTAGVIVNNTGTLQMGATNQFNTTTPAPVTLNGATGTGNAATFSVNGFSQGSTTATGVGALTLASTSGNNVIDFNGKNAIISFATLTTNGATLTINNYVSNSSTSPGNDPDELIFMQDQGSTGANNLGNIVFTGYGSATEQSLGGGFYEVFPTAVPEPATVLGGILMVGLLGWNQRRRVGAMAGLAQGLAGA